MRVAMPKKQLPHLKQREARSLDDIVAGLKKSRKAKECYLAVSEGFWEFEEQEEFESIFETYSKFFANAVTQAAKLLGEPSFQGDWESAEFPDWAHGLEIAVWDDAGLWLRLEHEDRECPIIVALGKIES